MPDWMFYVLSGLYLVNIGFTVHLYRKLDRRVNELERQIPKPRTRYVITDSS